MHKYKKIFILGAVLTAIFLNGIPYTEVGANSDVYTNFESITSEEGLSYNNISCIYQDHYGYIWIGTTFNLNKFDGIENIIYNNDPNINTSLSNPEITCIYETNNHHLLVGTASGLNIFNPANESFIKYLNDKHITVIFEDKEGLIWIGTKSGLYHLNLSVGTPDNSVNASYCEYDISSNHVTAIEEDIYGNIWIGTADGLNMLDIDKGVSFSYFNEVDNPHSISDSKISFVYEDSSEILWIGTLNGLNRFNRESRSFTKYLHDTDDPTSICNNYTITICEDVDSNLWIGTRSGFDVLNVGEMTFQHYSIMSANDSNFSINNRIQTICQDKQKNMWIGTLGGVFKLNLKQQSFQAYYDLLETSAVPAITSIDNNTLWLKTSSGLVKFDSQKTEIIAFYSDIFTKQDYTDFRMNSFCISSDGSLWAGTEGLGLERFNPSTEEYTIYSYDENSGTNIISNNIISISADDSNIIWIGTDKGLCSFNLGNELFTSYIDSNYPESIRTGEIWVIYTVSDNMLYIGTESGFYEINTLTEESTCILDNSRLSGSSSANTIRAVYKDSMDKLWFSTGYNLYCYDIYDNRLIMHDYMDLFKNELIRSIVEDDNGNIWIACAGKGLFKLNLDDGSYCIYGKDDGIISDIFCFRSSCKSKSGELFFGTTSGLISFYPEEIIEDNTLPDIFIKDFSLIDGYISFTEPVEDLKELSLSYSHNSFIIDFIALNFDSPFYNNYAYMLEGFDNNWTYCDANQSFARYTNIPSGEYIFRVMASNSDGLWNEEGASLNINVSTPFWLQWWFISLCAIFIAFLIAAYIKIKTNNMERYAQILENSVAERTIQLKNKVALHKKTEMKLKEEIDNRIKYTRALVHELKTPLTPLVAASDFLAENLIDEPYNSFAKSINTGALNLSRKIDDLIELARGELGMLRIEYSRIDATELITEVYEYMKPEALKNQQSLIVDIQSNLPTIKCDVDRIKQSLYNLIHNSFKFTPKGGIILIRAHSNSSIITIDIEDNGFGVSEKERKYLFEPYKRLDNDKAKLSGLGLGLFIVKQNIELHKGKIWMKKNKDGGSTFSFFIPLEPPDNSNNIIQGE